MQNARPADNHCKELRVQSVLTFNLHVYRGPRLAHVSPIQCTGPSTSSSTSWSKVTVQLRIFTSGHWQSVSAITSPSPQQWLNPYFGNPDWLSDLNHCCPCFGNTDSPVRYGTRIVFLDWSICKGSPLLMKYDKLFRKSHFVIFAVDKKHKGARTVWPIIVLARGDGGSRTFWQAPPRLPPTPFLPPVSFILACHTDTGYLHDFLTAVTTSKFIYYCFINKVLSPAWRSDLLLQLGKLSFKMHVWIDQQCISPTWPP